MESKKMFRFCFRVEKKKKYAFTLAEVLITLGIIGVVAAMTLPSLIADHREKETVVRLKKVYSILGNAYSLALNENGSPENWGMTTYVADSDGATLFLNNMRPYLKVLEFCGGNKGCFANQSVLTINGDPSYNYYNANSIKAAKMRLEDGVSMLVQITSSDCSVAYTSAVPESCGGIVVDINGDKKPNQWGKDIFQFIIQKTKLVPMGVATTTSPTYIFENTCYNGTGGAIAGSGCAAWVIYNENMDYLKCEGLSWNGKTKCK